jgi:hypothetical protein
MQLGDGPDTLGVVSLNDDTGTWKLDPEPGMEERLRRLWDAIQSDAEAVGVPPDRLLVREENRYEYRAGLWMHRLGE